MRAVAAVAKASPLDRETEAYWQRLNPEGTIKNEFLMISWQQFNTPWLLRVNKLSVFNLTCKAT
jgi:hypothetical protein